MAEHEEALAGRTRKGRVEAFSDGVFAIAITLLILYVTVPPPGRDGTLFPALLRQWPTYAAFAVSFITIGIIWVNHHALLDEVQLVDRPVLFLNLLLLATVVVLPFPTNLLGVYLQSGHDTSTAALVYGGAMTAMGAAFALMWLYLGRHRELLVPTLDSKAVRVLIIRSLSGTGIYAASMLLAPFNAYLCLLVWGGLAAFWGLQPSERSSRLRSSEIQSR